MHRRGTSAAQRGSEAPLGDGLADALRRCAELRRAFAAAQTAAHIVAPPTFTGELVKLDKGPAMEMLQKKHNLRPFILDVYNVEYHFDM